MLRNLTLTVIFLIIGAVFTNGQAPSTRMTSEDYIAAYHKWAVTNMKQTGIPASITLAQGMLESGNGNSTLAQEGNNHFGIKCHDDWTGKRVYHHDDRRNECFRKYKTVYDSYADHSAFLSTRSRYAFLFDLKTTDYKGWAKGLKKAGYATNPNYSQQLIKIIEENRLYLFDEEGGNERWSAQRGIRSRGTGSDYVIDPFRKHEVEYNNGVKYVRVKEGDTFESLSKEFNLREWEVPHYNDISDQAKVSELGFLYIEPKRNRAHRDQEYHVVEEGQSLQGISQMYGIKLKKLCRLNRMDAGADLDPGDKLNLRKRVKK